MAREGVPFVVAGGAILIMLGAAAATAGGWWMWVAAAWVPIAVWVPWFFRDPRRDGPRDARLILAPADGRVLPIVKVVEPDVVGGEAHRVSVFMNVFDVHVNRSPADGTVVHREYRPGAFVNASLDKASEKNERMSLGLSTEQGPLLVRQIAGLVARRIVTDAQVGDRLVQGERIGLIRFGSRVDTFLPTDAVIRVSEGDRTRAGITVIAEWPV